MGVPIYGNAQYALHGHSTIVEHPPSMFQYKSAPILKYLVKDLTVCSMGTVKFSVLFFILGPGDIISVGSHTMIFEQ